MDSSESGSPSTSHQVYYPIILSSYISLKSGFYEVMSYIYIFSMDVAGFYDMVLSVS